MKWHGEKKTLDSGGEAHSDDETDSGINDLGLKRTWTMGMDLDDLKKNVIVNV